MSRLYASIDSDARKTQATSRGHRVMSTHTRGWSLGVRVVASADPASDEDTFDVYVTSGSGGNGSDVLLGQVVEQRGQRYFFPAYALAVRDNAAEGAQL